MREIKFRAWNDIDKKMLDNGLVTRMLSVLLASKNYHVMQFTGLTDINGVNIYEGDICIWCINGLERLGEVYYHDQSFEMRSPSLGYIGWDANRGEIKVIGNIYQNLELLK